MNPPDYFLADLGPDARLTPQIVTEACLAVKANRRRYLETRRTPDLTEALAAVAEDWLDPAHPFRRLALERGPAALGLTCKSLEAGLTTFFETVTRDQLRALVEQDLGHAERLDQLSAGETEAPFARLSLAAGPDLLVQKATSPLPDPGLITMIMGVLVRSAQFVVCPPGGSLLLRLFAHSLREVEPKLAACIEIAEWGNGSSDLDDALIGQAGCFLTAGDDETLERVRSVLPGGVSWIGAGERLSFAYVAADGLSNYLLPKLAGAAARDVALWNQRGHLAPHAIYVEAGGRNAPDRFAEALAAELARIESVEPRGALAPDQDSAILARRAFYQVRAARSPETQVWSSSGSTAWTVVYDNVPRLSPSCRHRFVHVKAVAGIEEALQGADEFRGRISTVGLAASGTREAALVSRLAQWGVSRVCPLGRMHLPPPSWRRDGRPALGDLVRWTDWERHRGW